MNPVRYRILGTTQALRPDGSSVAVGGARLRALLTVLALRAGRSVPAGLLVEEVWTGDPPADAQGALQALVGRLRRALGADAIDSAEGGYRLAAAPDDVDLHRFERLTGDGVRALADGDPAKAAVLLDDALALWQGPALADLPDRTAEAGRWDARRLDALRARHTAAIAQGQAGQALPELTALCDAHPLDEPLQALRLRALRDAGRTAQALVAYDEVRRLLADRLGADPGPELRTLHTELLNPGDMDATDVPNASGGPWLTRDAGAGKGAAGAAGVPGGPGSSRDAEFSHGSGAAGGRGRSGVPGDPGSSRVPGDPEGSRDSGVPGGPGSSRDPGLSRGSGVSPDVRGVDRPDGSDRSDGFGGTGGLDGTGGTGGTGGFRGPGGPERHAFSGTPGRRTAAGSAERAGRPESVAPGDVASARPRPADAGAVGPGAGTSGPRAPGNLRARLTSFVGREDDIAAIREDLAGARLVTLLGPGGAGKTRLSQEAAETVRHIASDGVWLAELAPVAAPDAVPQAVLTAVGARETVLYGAGAEELRAAAERHGDPVERLVEHCARRRMLIILDNCEHVVEAAARLAEELLARCPRVTVLATSREPLGVPGERLRPLDPLPEPTALRLLADRGAAARPGFRTEDDPEACAEICRRLDGLPLALELAAARLRMLTPRQIADRLDDRFRLLTSGSRTVLPRQQTLRAVVDWSWDLLDADERDVLARLSVFARGCDLAAVEAVCGAAPNRGGDGGGDGRGDADGGDGRGDVRDARAGRPPRELLDTLASLVDKSLVVAAPAPGGDMRYRLLETVAEYAAERLDESGGRAAAERAHLTYYREFARTTEPLLRGPGQREAAESIQLEYENLRTALRRAVAARDEQEALSLTLSLIWYWQMRDLRLEAGAWCAEVMALGPDPFAEPLRRAAPVWKPCTDSPPPLTGETLLEARRGVHLAHLACLENQLDDWQTPAAQRKLTLIAKAYEPGLPQTCRAPGLLWFFAVMLTGDTDRIRVIVDANVDTCRRTPGFEWELASCLQMRANILANRADWAGNAFRDADEALEIYRRLGDVWGIVEALSARAEAHERLGDYRRAAADYVGARTHAEQIGARAQSAVLGARLGSVLLEAGDAEQGERLLREVIDGPAHGGNEAVPAARLFLAGWLGSTGRIAEAREQLRLLRECFSFGNFAVFDAFILGAEAWLEVVDGRYEQALPGIRAALGRATDPVSRAVAPHLCSFYLAIAATALTGLDDGADAAARCLGAAAALLPPRHVFPRLEREARELALSRTRAALGDERFERAYAEGGGLSYEEATALV
ncbi:putative ATPase/DNA-binding SARP family transcriptional activator [Streptomyces sp. B4I13]|uniref:AfsR/SARP family transcriptional regulator n=1 Tax=Streptomyces sp. B4I13 TaxID=3042271 RepID=UPI00277ED144|nr:BTAD domain-containing putative transcriptional regulator [Streptomyces sp. B4I13]MDQ0962328.1 putative ATPase/DNA-binding SARP family transcriptional activator [Streptomyces sp. B4I13]